MIVRMGSHAFDDVVYDAVGDVLYMHKGKPVAAARTLASEEGHAVMLDDAGEIPRLLRRGLGSFTQPPERRPRRR
jgi:hypothetical protein